MERREEMFGKRIDIAGDDLSGDETASILSKASGHEITYEGFDPEFLRKDSEDMADMFKWFDDVGYIGDIEKLHNDFPEVKWQSLKDWVQEQDWSVL